MATSAFAKYITESLKPWASSYTKASHKNNDNNGPAPASALAACPLRADVGTASSSLPSAGSRGGRAAPRSRGGPGESHGDVPPRVADGMSGDVRPHGSRGSARVPSYSLHSIRPWAGQHPTRSSLKLRIRSLNFTAASCLQHDDSDNVLHWGPQSQGQQGNPD